MSEIAFDWSGRHVRLRYQAVASALLFVGVTLYGVSKVSILGAVVFNEVPPQGYLIAGTFILSFFNLFGLVSRTISERDARYDQLDDAKKTLKYFEENLKGCLDFSSYDFENILRAQEEAISSDLKRNDNSVKFGKAASELEALIKDIQKTSSRLGNVKSVVEDSAFLKSEMALSNFSHAKILRNAIISAPALLGEVKGALESQLSFYDSKNRMTSFSNIEPPLTKIEGYEHERDRASLAVDELKKIVSRKRLIEFIEHNFLSVIAPIGATLVLLIFGIWRLICG